MDPGDDRFSQLVNDVVVGDPGASAMLGDLALARVGGKVRHCMRCPLDHFQERKKDIRDATGDARVLGDLRDDSGRRGLEFGRSVGYFKNLDVPG